MKSIFAFCLVLGLVLSANSTFSLTKTRVFAQSVSGIDVTANAEVILARYVDIVCYPTYCSLLCQYNGYVTCSFQNALSRGACTGCEEDFFNAGNAQEMFDYAVAQITSSVNSGTYVNNIIPPGGTHYFRSITWNYNSGADEYTMTLTLTEITP